MRNGLIVSNKTKVFRNEKRLQLVDEISRGCQWVDSVNILSPSAEVM